MFQLICELFIKNLKSIPAFININQMNEIRFMLTSKAANRAFL